MEEFKNYIMQDTLEEIFVGFVVLEELLNISLKELYK